MEELSQRKKNEFITRIKDFLNRKYKKELFRASEEEKALEVDIAFLDKAHPDIVDILKEQPESIFEVFEEATEQIELPGPVNIRFKNHTDLVNIRDLRARHIGKFIAIEGIVRRSSEIRPEITASIWECPECGDKIEQEARLGFVSKPYKCECGNTKGFKQAEAKLIDTRRIVIDEPFELTEGEKPSQMNIILQRDLCSKEGRRMTDAGNRLRITGMLRDIPKGKFYSSKLDFYFEANHIEPTELGWEKVEVSKEDEKRIKKLSNDPMVYKKLVGSLAPSLYGLSEIKESIILQLFGGVPKLMRDNTKIRGDIHVLLLGDPAAGKCVSGNTNVILINGEIKKIEDIVENKLKNNKEKIKDGWYAEGNDDLLSLSLIGKMQKTKANIFWKRKSPKSLYNIETYSGKTITVTPTHPFFICSDGSVKSIEASKLSKNDFIASPRKLSIKGKQQNIRINVRRSKANNAKHIIIPKKTTPRLCKFLAYILAEGYVQKREKSKLIWFTNNDPKILKDFEMSAKIFNIPIHKRIPHKGKTAWDYYLSSIELVDFLEKIEPSFLEKSKNKKIPNIILRASDNEIKEFLQVFFDCEAHIGRRGIELSTASKIMAEQIQILLLRFSILSQVHGMMKRATNSPTPKYRKYYRIIVSGSDLKKFSKMIGFSTKKKNKRLEMFKNKFSISDVIPNLSETLKYIRKHLGLSQFDMGIKRTTYQHYERGDRNPTKRIMNVIVRNIEEKIKEMKIEDKKLSEKIESLIGLNRSDIFWDRVKNIEKIKSNEKWVYDLQIPEVHNFIANQIFVHNSQLLKLAPTIVPRGKYVSGKGVSTAGLCTTYDSIIQKSDGGFAKIGDVVEDEIKHNCKEVRPGVFVSEKQSGRIVSFNKNKMKIEPKKITKFWKLKAPTKLTKIISKTGKDIIVTPDNPILVINKGELIWKRASKLTGNDYIACSRVLLPSNKRNVNLTEYIDESAKILNAANIVNNTVEKIKEKTTLREYTRSHDISENQIYHLWRDVTNCGKPSLKALRMLCEDTDTDFYSTLPSKLILSQYNGHKIEIPKKLNKEFAYIMGLVAGDGNITKTPYGGSDIKFTNNDVWLMDEYKKICANQLGFVPKYRKQWNRIQYYRFSSKIIGAILNDFGIPTGKKSKRIHINRNLSLLPNELLGSYIRGVFDTDGSVMMRSGGSNLIELDSASEMFIKGIQLLMLKFGIISFVRKRNPTKSKIRGREVVSGYKWTLEIRGLGNFKKFHKNIGFKLPRKQIILEKIISKTKNEHTNFDIIPNIGHLIKKARNDIGLSSSDIFGYKNYHYEEGRTQISKNKLKWLVNKMKINGSNKTLKHLEKLANSDIVWEKIKKVETFQNKDHDYVYDVTVEDEHSFVCNGMVIHNTATVTKDEEFMGGWVLEAGAIVLANKGILSIDEFEKMAPEDSVAMHEALEQGSVSIAKASIVATLPAETSVLAGGNPKFSRFDPMLSIMQQITIVPTLLSRFDLKFILKDLPNSAKDKLVVEHMLRARQDENYEGAKPVLETDFLRRYIAYSKEHCKPELTVEVGNILKKFYIDSRKRAEQEGSPVPITLRQFEAMIRLAEASAKIQLSDVVRKEDAKRAIKLMTYSLQQLGFDPATGKIDIDLAEGGVASSERSKIRIVMDIINKLSEKKKEVPIGEIITAAKKEGVEEVDDVVDKLKKEGMLFEPSAGYVQKV